MEYTVIGTVESRFKETAAPEEMQKHQSRIVIADEFGAGLYQIEESSHLQVLFYFHRAQDYKLKSPRRSGEVKGVFASRSPHRPTPIGVTTVRLLGREGNTLTVRGLDAIDGTPVVDIKPFAATMDLPD